MTKSTITRERIQRIIRAIDSEAYDEEEIREWLSSDEIMELSRMALAAMDGEPVVFTDERNLHHIAMGRETSLIWGKQNSETGDIPLYRHAKLVPDALIQAVAFYEQVKRENPPVETGAYKDAVEWVLKEACRAVIKDE